jgi:hypothetical protein
MRFGRSVNVLVLCISALALIATVCGIFSDNGPGEREFTTVFGQAVTLYGKGMYGNNTVGAVRQAVPQDIVTLVIGIPLLIISLVMAGKGSLRGKIMLAGALGYFLITYMMYTFMAMYNRLFLVYVSIMSTGLFAFILTLLELNIENISTAFDKKLPVRFIGGYLMFSAAIIGLLWLKRCLPTLIDGSVPPEVELGTTLPVQAFDLAFFLPGTFLSGLLIVKKKPSGFLLAPVAAVSSALIMTALLSKGISMQLAGTPGTLPLMVMTSLFALLAIVSVVVTLKKVIYGNNR